MVINLKKDFFRTLCFCLVLIRKNKLKLIGNVKLTPSLTFIRSRLCEKEESIWELCWKTSLVHWYSLTKLDNRPRIVMQANVRYEEDQTTWWRTLYNILHSFNSRCIPIKKFSLLLKELVPGLCYYPE